MFFFSKLKNYEKVDKDILSKILYIIQVIFKTEDTIALGENFNFSLLFNIFAILTSTYEDLDYAKIFNSLAAFAMYDHLNNLMRINYLDVLFKMLIELACALKGQNNALNYIKLDPRMIFNIETLVARILRIIFSLEKNKKYFKKVFSTKLLSIFIDIGNYKHNLNLYEKFINEINSFSLSELEDLLNKANLINNPKESEMNTIGGYKIIELIVILI